jgi:carbamoyl-phosphate synthase large subunit
VINILKQEGASSSPRITLLFTSAGRRVALIRAFHRAIDQLGIPGRIVCVDASNLSAAARIADEYFVVPRCSDPDYISVIARICQNVHASLLFPLIDTELSILSGSAEKIEETGCVPVVSTPSTISIARDKRLTAEFFKSIKIATPEVLSVDDVRANPDVFPIFLKPIDGSASIGSRILLTLEDLEYWLPRTPGAMILQHIRGQEFTVDVYAGLSGSPRCAVPRLRMEVRAGEVSKGLTVVNRQIMEDALRIVRNLPGPRGVITLQCILPESGPPCFFEINARFGGGVPLSIESGADFPLWLLTEFLGGEPEIGDPGFQPDMLMLRYDDGIFIQR